MTHESLLDNPIWHALTTEQAAYAEANGLAKRYPPSVTPLAGMAEPSARAYEDLAGLLGAKGAAGLVLDGCPDIPSRLQILERDEIAQMICESPHGMSNGGMESLAEHDVPEMIALAELTHPGPFGVRTRELGTYLGIRLEGKLVAMAGERLRLNGFTEISAVCTHPNFQGRGFGSALVSALISKATARGDVPFLHVRRENAGAIRVYEKLGFTLRRVLNFVVVKPAMEVDR
jgi:ribosomal protein S18 acetylase RimI-like enzyme